MLIVGELKSNLDIRAVIHDKSSLAPKGDAFAFKLSKEKGFQWIGKYDINSDELLAGYHKESEKSRATQFILEQLSSGPVASVEIFKQAHDSHGCPFDGFEHSVSRETICHDNICNAIHQITCFHVSDKVQTFISRQ